MPHILLLYHVICMNLKPYLLPCESTCAYGSPVSSSSFVSSNLLPSNPTGLFYSAAVQRHFLLAERLPPIVSQAVLSP